MALLDPLHTCHLPGCTTYTPQKFLYCRPHWNLVSPGTRTRVWRAYREAGGTGAGPITRATQEYVDATKQAEAEVLAALAKGRQAR